MNQVTPDDLPALRQQLTQAVMAQDMDKALSLIKSPPPAGDAALDQIASKLYMATQNWPLASQVLARMDTRQPAVMTQLNLARNLTQTKIHRPALYDVLVNTPAAGIHTLHQLPSGQLTVARKRIDQPPLLLCLGSDPATAAKAASQALSTAMAKGNTLGLNGAGDGYLLVEIARMPSPLILNQTIAVHIYEPDPELVLQTMMIHDYTGPTGPLEQQRFEWHVGPSWQQVYEDAMLSGTFTLPEPMAVAQVSGDPEALKSALAKVQKKALQRDQDTEARLEEHYKHYSFDQFKAMCSDHPPRQPRVLLVTSRFTTVLQHETRRIARAFEALGWATEIVMEPHDHHRMLAGAMHRVIDSFKPDLFFALDHLRVEQSRIIPPNLPYLCWVQDLLSTITTAQAGRSVGDNDWVISFCTPLLTGRYQYPANRCIDAPIMMASEPALPASWENNGPDLAYVSNLSQQTSHMVETTLKAVAPEDQPLLSRCCDKVIAHYENGLSLPSKTDIGQLITPLLRSHFSSFNQRMDFDKAVMLIIDALWNPLNIGLYRQQALRWVAQVASEQNLTLAIYGNGWENNPEFASYAQGSINPGEPLQQLVRSAKINLNLEPYPCTTHVRLLDGLTAGGFYLVRHHPANTLLPELAAFISEHAPDATTDQEALAMTPKAHHRRLRELLASTQGVSYDHPADVVAQMRCYQNANVMHEHQPLLPSLAEVTFDDLESCRQRITQFIASAPQRKSLRDKQRAAVVGRLTLKEGLARILSSMRNTVVDQPAVTAGKLKTQTFAVKSA